MFVIIKTLAQMLFHFFYFSLFREQMKKIFNFENTVLTNNLQSFLDTHYSSVIFFCSVSLEQMFCNFHPKFFSNFVLSRFVCIILCKICVVTFQSKFNSFRIHVQNSIQNDLSFHHLRDLFSKIYNFFIMHENILKKSFFLFSHAVKIIHTFFHFS